MPMYYIKTLNIFACLLFSDVFFFFFSSRRRHTRSDRDWSSDVCSSDLDANQALLDHFPQLGYGSNMQVIDSGARPRVPQWLFPAGLDGAARRVGNAAWRYMQWTRRGKPEALARVAYVRATMRPYTLFDEADAS